MIKATETVNAKKEMGFRLVATAGGAPVPGHAFVGGEIVVFKPGVVVGTNALGTVVEKSVGYYAYCPHVNEMVGGNQIQVLVAAAACVAVSLTADLVAYDPQTTDLAILRAIVEGPNQIDGGGEVTAPATPDTTLVGALREILAWVSGNGTALVGPQAVVKSRGGGRNRAVIALNNGNRTVVSRDNT